MAHVERGEKVIYQGKEWVVDVVAFVTGESAILQLSRQDDQGETQMVQTMNFNVQRLGARIGVVSDGN